MTIYFKHCIWLSLNGLHHSTLAKTTIARNQSKCSRNTGTEKASCRLYLLNCCHGNGNAKQLFMVLYNTDVGGGTAARFFYRDLGVEHTHRFEKLMSEGNVVDVLYFLYIFYILFLSLVLLLFIFYKCLITVVCNLCIKNTNTLNFV